MRESQQPRGLGDDQLVGVGQWHLVLSRLQSGGDRINVAIITMKCSIPLLYIQSLL